MKKINPVPMVDKTKDKNEKKIIYELSDEEILHCCSLGKAYCLNIYHGIFIGTQHKENFWQRVCGFRIIEGDNVVIKFEKVTGQKYYVVEFYEKNNDLT